ncbi:fimbrial protein [Serratia symbiotica]|uniref:Fimbrial protein n=2 Tax=Serratia symbiotica TaxID=138074 RepID=A0A068Z5J5_9GAMM|nr:fimbrial protein [Serratia symbiotica]MBF1994875.1 fimbrial protein [Serratia symbiotica]MBQ0955013.1 fimbrial protein [Serratia symbiotica]QLH64015.1 fimbrial protein [Serratia symbiotica]QTP14420.1 fimbrial protein [Serratia symbiotica]CDS56184.1 Type I pilus assembly protein FimE [Serratia symbiotica]
MKNPYVKICLLALALLPPAACANGYVTPDSGPKQFYINLNSSNITNQIGFTKLFTYTLGGSYSGKAYCDTTIPKSPHYYKSDTSLPASDYGHGYLQLNEFLDLKAEVWIAGNKKTYVTVPFYNQSNEYFRYSCTPPYVQVNEYGSGSKGRVTFRVRKKIINGVQINDRQIIELYGRLGSSDAGFGPNPMAQVYIQSAILFVPDKCVVNEGQLINVEFGEISGSNLNGSSYPQHIPVHFQCAGGSFEDGSLNIKLAVSGTAASFNDNAFKTNKSDLGIQLTHNGELVIPNVFYPVPNIGNGGSWNLLAVPLANGNKEIDEGEFNASATIVASFQ